MKELSTVWMKFTAIGWQNRFDITHHSSGNRHSDKARPNNGGSDNRGSTVVEFEPIFVTRPRPAREGR